MYTEILRKYAPVLCVNLYPTQARALLKGLKEYQQGLEPYFRDAFVRLAYQMIVADLEWQQERDDAQ